MEPDNDMSEDQKFRLSLTLTNLLMLGGMIGGGILFLTAGVQKYDDLSGKINIVSSDISKLENQSAQVTLIQRSFESTITRIENQEKREMVLEGKVDALTQILNEFIGTVNRSQIQKTNPNPEGSGHP